MKKIIDDEKFIRHVESLIDPDEVSYTYFFQKFKRLLPLSLFKKLLLKTSKKTPYIGFVIDPYSFFLFYKLKDIEKAKSLLPERYELQKVSIYADDEPDYYFGMGALNTRASTFWGVRLESYLIAKDNETGLLSWIFIDILSNTLIALPTEGIADPNSTNSFFTTSSKGEIFLDIKEDNTNRQIVLTGDIKNGKKRRLNENLWLMGNTSIAHSKKLRDDNDDPFAVIFDPSEVEEALDIPLKDIKLIKNTLFPDLTESEPSKAACFPYAQHYLADSPGCRTYIKDRKEMIEIYKKMSNLKEIKTFSSKTVRKLFFIGISFSTLLSIILFILLMLQIY